ncbi:MAG: hypothetical protein R2838_16825 [Caldilineaceae bacterium]
MSLFAALWWRWSLSPSYARRFAQLAGRLRLVAAAALASSLLELWGLTWVR